MHFAVCLEFINNPAVHACTRPCSRCHQFTCSARQDQQSCIITCEECLGQFPTQDCFQSHLRCTIKWGAKKEEKTICLAYKRCPDCYAFVQAPGRPRSTPHNCDAQYCPLCKKFVDRNHLCFMKTGSAAVPKKHLVGKSKQSRTVDEQQGIEDLLFEEEDFLPDGKPQMPPPTKRG